MKILAALLFLTLSQIASAQWDCSQVQCGGCGSDCLQCHVGGGVQQDPTWGCYCDGNCSDGCPNGQCSDGYGGCVYVGPQCASAPEKHTQIQKPTVVRIEDIILSYLSVKNGVITPATAGKIIHVYPAGTPKADLALSMGGMLYISIKLDADGLPMPKNHVTVVHSSKPSTRLGILH